MCVLFRPLRSEDGSFAATLRALVRSVSRHEVGVVGVCVARSVVAKPKGSDGVQGPDGLSSADVSGRP